MSENSQFSTLNSQLFSLSLRIMKYVKNFKIGFHQTDLNFRLKPYEFFYMAQDIGTEHCDSQNCGQAQLLKHNLGWMLVKQTVEFLKMPENLQEVTMKTWHKGQSGPVFYRDFVVESASGEMLIRSASIWVTVDVVKRTLARPDAIMTDCLENDSVMEDRSLKIQIPAEAPVINEVHHTVEYSDVDCNRHANNTSYLIWAFNAMPFEILANNAVKRMEVSFVNEARPQTDVKIVVCQISDTEYGIKMTDNSNGKSLFVAKISF